MKISLFFSLFAFYITSGMAIAESSDQYIYKWKDKQGMVHYTERRPQPGILFEKVKRASNGKTSTPSKVNPKNTQEEVQKKEDSYQTWRHDNCKIATQNLDVLQNAARISQDDGQGGKRLMTDEEKQEKIKKMTEQKKKYCVESETSDKKD